MNTTMKWLLKREFWEHKGGFFWAPAVVGAIMTLAVLGLTVSALAMGHQPGFDINGVGLNEIAKEVDPVKLAFGLRLVSEGYILASIPLFMVMAAVVFFYCLGNLFDERKDRSVLFWKSLPVSDSETVLSKVGMALVGAPVITLAFGTALGLVFLLIFVAAGAATGVNVLGVFGNSTTYTAPFAIVSILPVYVIWALPTVGWLMMVSAWARTKVFLWAVGVPVLTGVLLAWFNAMFDFNWDVKWFWENIVARGLLSVVPGSWFAFVDPPGGISVGQHNPVFLWPLVGQSWKTLASVHAVVGAVAGGAMLYAAVRIRRWKDEG